MFRVLREWLQGAGRGENHGHGKIVPLLYKVGFRSAELVTSINAMDEHAAERVGDADVVFEYLKAGICQVCQFAALIDQRIEFAFPCVEPMEYLLDGIEHFYPVFFGIGLCDVAVGGF